MIRITQRQAGLVLIGSQAVGMLLMFFLVLLSRDQNPLELLGTGTSVFIYGGLFVAYWRRWERARYVAVIFSTVFVGLALPLIARSESQAYAAILPPIMALMLVEPGWVAGSAVAVVVIMAIRMGGLGIYANPFLVVLFVLIVTGLVVSRLVADTSQRMAEEETERANAHANQASEALERVERQTRELEQQNEEQRRLLDLVAELETPAIPLSRDTLLAPIVGTLDSRRAQAFTTRLLHEVYARHVRQVVLDITGVVAVDTEVAQTLMRTVQALRLLGCRIIITGISSSVATTITQLGITFDGVEIARSPQEVLGRIYQRQEPARSRHTSDACDT
ncbi:MAG: STAS domain-containing protein [Chloroflexaceae bacterium]|nr:STAS domain-containing protein [Chloroflexaceae bacterium]